MSSKLERWKKLSAEQPRQAENKNKQGLVDDLSRVKNSADEDVVRSKSIAPTETIGVGSKSNKSEYSVEVESKSSIAEDKVGVQNRSIDSEYKDEVEESAEDKNETARIEPNQFVNRVSQGLVSIIESKVTQADTHKKTSFQLKKTTLAKLANFDKAMGGRIQGLFINDLLDNFFEELEQDKKWEKILNKKTH